LANPVLVAWVRHREVGQRAAACFTDLATRPPPKQQNEAVYATCEQIIFLMLLFFFHLFIYLSFTKRKSFAGIKTTGAIRDLLRE
jgi:hypothetical protein